MLTSFGKFCRKLRIDKDQVLLDMASELGVTPSFLSAVENGKKNVPDSWCEILRERYELEDDEYQEMIKAKEYSKTQVKLNLTKYADEDRNLAFSFARNFESLSKEQKAKILEILNK